MTDEVNLPARLGPGASLDDLIRTVAALQDWVETREPTSFGGRLNKFMTVSETVQAGLLAYAAGGAASGPAGDSVVPGALTSNPADTSQPTPIGGLAVASGVGYYMVEFDAPTYTQGGGNGRTIIYAANYSGAGPLPTFGNAVEVGTVPGRSTIGVISSEPGVQTHFWAKAETRHPTLQATPTGGTNGVTSTADLVANQHIVSLSAGKITAGAISVGEYIQSTGFVAGSAGWRIMGDGTAEFSGVIVRGTLYATAGEIGGLTVNGALTMNALGHIKGGQTAYNTGTGFFIGYSGAAYKFSIGNGTVGMTWDGSSLAIAGTLTVGTSPAVSGSTMTGLGAVFNTAGSFAIGNATRNLSFDGSTLTMNGDLVITGNVQANAITVPLTYTDGSTYTGDSTNQQILSYAFSMPSAGTIIAFWKAIGGYTSATDVHCYVKLDGTQIGYTFSGSAQNDSPSATGYSAAAAGSHTLTIEMNSTSGYSVSTQTLVILGVQR